MSLDDSQRPTKVRHLVIAVTTVMAVLLYLDRYGLLIAAKYIREDMRLTQIQFGQFMGAFFWSYALAQVPSGWFSDRYGARIMLVAYILTWSAFTALMGAATSFALLWGTRFAVGLGQAGAYPTAGGLISKWVPLTGRGLASSWVSLGGRIGGSVVNIVTAFLLVQFTPLSVPATVEERAMLNAGQLCARMAPLDSTSRGAADGAAPSALGQHIYAQLPLSTQATVRSIANEYRDLKAALAVLEREKEESGALPTGLQAAERSLEEYSPPTTEVEPILAGINALIRDPEFYVESRFPDLTIDESEAQSLLARRAETGTLTQPQTERLNRLVLEAAFPGDIARLYRHGWRMLLFVYGAAGLLVAAAFWLCFRNSPSEHPWCNSAERELIAAGRPAEAADSRPASNAFPLVDALVNVGLWLNSAMQTFTNIGWLFLVSFLPSYLSEVHRVPLSTLGWMTAIPLGIGIAGMLAGGKVTDMLVPRIGLRWGRRAPMMLTRFTAAAGYGICIWLTWMGGPMANPWFFVAAFSLVAFSTDMGNPAVWAYFQDAGGKHVGSLLGWGNMWGNFGAAFAPSIYAHILGNSPSVKDWNNVFAMCLAAFVLSGLCAWGVDAATPIVRADRAAGDG
jgi:ACS family glucarate transporter-like MFS transporter